MHVLNATASLLHKWKGSDVQKAQWDIQNKHASLGKLWIAPHATMERIWTNWILALTGAAISLPQPQIMYANAIL